MGTCLEVLTIRVLPSGRLWLRSVSKTRKNFSESINASHAIASRHWSGAPLVQFDHLLAMMHCRRPGLPSSLFLIAPKLR
jgi:hypothetical protein